MSVKVAGYNDYRELICPPNNKCNDFHIISPPCDAPIDPFSIVSFSSYFAHSVWVTKDHHIYASGNNGCCRITNELPDSQLASKPSTFSVIDNKAQFWRISSVLCGYHYTLYMGQPFGHNPRLIYFYHNRNKNFPLVLNLQDHYPIAIFGGKMRAAAIDEKGGIFVITNEVFNDNKKPLPRFTLPDGEKAVSVACCDKFLIAISASGRIYGQGIISETSDENDNGRNYEEFQEIKELCGVKIIDISGTLNHCFAVSQNGRVFALGDNQYGQLGLGKDIVKAYKFTEIMKLSSYHIDAAYAGSYHSLFQTATGEILSCGYNGYGDLLLSGPTNEMIYTPVETEIKSGATFCIAGNGVSIVFVDCPPPENCPNRTVTEGKVCSEVKMMYNPIKEDEIEIKDNNYRAWRASLTQQS